MNPQLEIFREERNGIRTVAATDAPGSGNAYHSYAIWHQNSGDIEPKCIGRVSFQSGPIKEAGVNGIHNEDLLAIVEHRLACFQTSQFACKENEHARSHVKEAMLALASRTKRRVEAGVEGTHVAEPRAVDVSKPDFTMHPAVRSMLQFFEYGHLPPHLQTASRPFCGLAKTIAAGPQNAETTIALRKLLEAKDAAVRAVIFKG